MTFQPYKHLLPTYQSIVLFFNCLPMARINLKRATMPLVTNQAEHPIGQTWQMRSPRLTIGISSIIRLRSGAIERIWKMPLIKRREVLRRDGPNCQYYSSRCFCRIILKSAEELIAYAAVGM